MASADVKGTVFLCVVEGKKRARNSTKVPVEETLPAAKKAKAENREPKAFKEPECVGFEGGATPSFKEQEGKIETRKSKEKKDKEHNESLSAVEADADSDVANKSDGEKEKS